MAFLRIPIPVLMLLSTLQLGSAERMRSDLADFFSLSDEAPGGIPEGNATKVPGRGGCLADPDAMLKHYIEEHQEEPAIAKPLTDLTRMIGLRGVKRSICQLFATLRVEKKRLEDNMGSMGTMSNHMLFLGNPGTGKTVIARIVGELLVGMGVVKVDESAQTEEPVNETKLDLPDPNTPPWKKDKKKNAPTKKKELIFKEVSKGDLIASYKGQTAPKVKEVVKSAFGGILFIDEAYSLAMEGSKSTFGQEAVDTLIQEMENHRDKVIVILAGYKTEMDSFLNSNPGFRSRISESRTFAFEDYSCTELVKMGELMLNRKGMHLLFPKDETPLKEAPEFLCESNPSHPGCHWLKTAAEYSTSCCINVDEDCPQNKDNGNGRSIRNILEASYRQLATRVMGDHDKDDLDKIKPSGDVMKGCSALEKGEKSKDTRCDFAFVADKDMANVVANFMREDYKAHCPGMLRVEGGKLHGLAPQDLKDLVGDFQVLRARESTSVAKRKACSAIIRVQSTLVGPSTSDGTVGSDSLLETSGDVDVDGDADIEDEVWYSMETSFLEVPANDSDSDPGESSGCKSCLHGVKYLVSRVNAGKVQAFLGFASKMREYCKGSGLLGAEECSEAYHKLWNDKKQIQDILNFDFTEPKLQEICTQSWGAACLPKKPLALKDKLVVPLPSRGGPGRSGQRRRKIPGAGLRPAKDPAIKKLNDKTANKDKKSKADAIMEELMTKYVGLATVKASMLELRALVEFDLTRKRWFGEDMSIMGQSFHMKFLGNPGSGKTVVARLVGELLVALGVIEPPPKEFFCKGRDYSKEPEELVFREVARADLVGEYVGNTAPRVQGAICDSLGGVLFIDEAYSLVKNNGKDPFGQEAVDTLIKEMEDKRKYVVVILAGYEDEMEDFIDSNPGFKSRVPNTFYFADYSCSELSTIGSLLYSKKGIELTQDGKEAMSSVVKITTGCCEDADSPDCVSRKDNGNGRSVRNIVEGSFRFLAARSLNDPDPEVQKELKSLEVAGEDYQNSWNTWYESECNSARNRVGMQRSRCRREFTKEKFYEMNSKKHLEWVGEPCTLGKYRCEILSIIKASDIEQVLQEQVYHNLHNLCSPTEGHPAKASLSDLRWQVRVIPTMEPEDVKKLKDITKCTEGVDLLKKYIAKLPQKESDPSLQEPVVVNLEEAPCGVKEVFGELQELIGLGGVKRTMLELYSLVQYSKIRENLLMKSVSETSFHMKFVGNPGTGKTVVARLVGELLLEMRAVEVRGKEHESLRCQPDGKKKEGTINFQEVSRADLVAEYQGQTAPKVIGAVENALGGVLFIDEAYSIVKAGGNDNFGIEAVDTLIKAMEDKRKEVVVILAGYEEEMNVFFESNPGFKSRVPITFHFDDYTCSDLMHIAKLKLGKADINLPTSPTGADDYERIIKFASGCCDKEEDCRISRENGNGRTVRNVVEATTRLMSTRILQEPVQPTAKELLANKEKWVIEYTTLKQQDLVVTANELAEGTLGRTCAKDGMVAMLTEAIAAGELRSFLGKDEPPGKQLFQIASKVRSAESDLGQLSDQTEVVQVCKRELKALSDAAQVQVAKLCGAGTVEGSLRSYASKLDPTKVLERSMATALATSAGSIESLISLLTSFEDVQLDSQLAAPFCTGCSTTCEEAMADLHKGHVMMSLGSLLTWTG